MFINLGSEAAVSTLATSDFVKAVKQQIGFDTETPDESLPVDITDLLHQCIQICEREQWRFILRKTVTLTLPYSAFTNRDSLCFLPFGRVTSLASFSYRKSDNTTVNISAADYSILSEEPSKLWCDDWELVFADIHESHPYPITLSYTTGYSSFPEIPKSTVRALTILAYHLFENRDAVSESVMSALPQGYAALRDHNLLNDHRAIRYVVDDWSKVSRG
jgi:hypothetical protein